MLTFAMLAIYIIMVGYVIWRSIHVFKRLGYIFKYKRFTVTYAAIILFMSILLIAGAFLPVTSFQAGLHRLRYYWLGFFIYMIFFMVIADIIALIDKIVRKNRPLPMEIKKYCYRVIAGYVLFASLFFTLYGVIHSHKLTQRTYEVAVNKDGGSVSGLKIALIADLHLGYTFGAEQMEAVVEKINAMNPDLIIVAGDIYDNSYDAIQDPERCARILSGLKSTYGTYAVYGNHDVESMLIGGFSVTDDTYALRDERLVKFCADCGFTMLEDDVVLIDDSFYLIGRMDLEITGNGTTKHRTADELTKDLDKSKPIIMITHEPDELYETADAGVDLLLSGHTHAGQFFPLTIVQPFRWKNYWGIKQFDDMYSIVTSGVGVYGPSIRVFTDSEVVEINVTFE
ncbi:MAG: metallophosphoesterase [Lachnospiraceae bacterium]|nr:metallophosphoesterase [Lachnospiraceae bacterium]